MVDWSSDGGEPTRRSTSELISSHWREWARERIEAKDSPAVRSCRFATTPC